MEAHLDTVLNSLSPPQRGEGWGEGILFFRNIDLLTPALSSFLGGEGENKNRVKMRLTDSVNSEN